MGKGEITRNKQFLLFPQRFLPFLESLRTATSLNSELSSANSYSSEGSKICSLGKG